MRVLIRRGTVIGCDALDKGIVPNAGIVVLRFRDNIMAKVVYVYFLSKDGQEFLRKIYSDNNERVSEKAMKTMQLPKHILDTQFMEQSIQKFEELNTHGIKISEHIQSIKALLGF